MKKSIRILSASLMLKRTLAILLASLMLISAMVSCGKSDVVDNTEQTNMTTATPDGSEVVSENTTVTTTVAETENPYDENGYLKDDLNPELDYKGEVFTILYWSDVERIEFEVESQTGDLIGDALFNRNAAVEERLGIDFEWIGTLGNNANKNAFVAVAENDVKSGGEYDVFAGYSMTGASIALQGLSRNLMDVEHINFDQPWWPDTLIELATINDRLYFCSGDISTNMLHMMYCTLYNKDFATELGIGNLYEMVDKGTWTLDKMAELASSSYSDLNGDTIRDVGDRYGVSVAITTNFDAFYPGGGLNVIEKDANGTPVVSDDFYSEKAHALLGKVVAMFHETNYAAFPESVSGWGLKPFAEGRVLFLVDRNYVTSSGDFADTNVNYGVLPVPKFDESQENYHTCLSFPYTMYSISIATDDAKADMAGAVLECMASESYRQVTPAVFEIAMKLKYSGGDDDARMYDIVRDSVHIDLGRVFNTPLQSIDWSVFRYGCRDGNPNWSSNANVQGRVMEKLMAKIVETLDQLAAGQ